MVAVTLLDEARRDGVKIEVIDGELQIEAETHQKHWLRKLRPHKHEILELIGGNGQHHEPSGADLWPEPRPLPNLLPPVEPFDSAMLPDRVCPYVEDVAERMQCPIDFPAVAMMIVLAGVVGRKVAVRPKRRDDWTVVANLWGPDTSNPGRGIATGDRHGRPSCAARAARGAAVGKRRGAKPCEWVPPRNENGKRTHSRGRSP